MMHPATCHGWQTGRRTDCDCPPPADRGFRIRKHPNRAFSWRIDRHTRDGDYITVMGCASFPAAVAMVNQLLWMRANALSEDRRHVR